MGSGAGSGAGSGVGRDPGRDPGWDPGRDPGRDSMHDPTQNLGSGSQLETGQAGHTMRRLLFADGSCADMFGADFLAHRSERAAQAERKQRSRFELASAVTRRDGGAGGGDRDHVRHWL